MSLNPKTWLENRPEDEIHWEWIKEVMDMNFQTIEQAMHCARTIPKFFGIERGA